MGPTPCGQYHAGSNHFRPLVRQRFRVSGLKGFFDLKWEIFWDVGVLKKKYHEPDYSGKVTLSGHPVFSFVAKLSWMLPFWRETATQDYEKLIDRWETKRFALLTSCWLPVELLLVVVAFGFVVACHHLALGWWIHFPRKDMGTFWQWHLPDPWKQQRPVDGTFL